MMFFEFTQNNSFGHFDVDEHVCHRVIIEADTEADAVSFAEELGCYWDGVADGIDCPCCGDRWYKCPDVIKAFPYKYSSTRKFKTIDEYASYLADDFGWTSPDVRVFFKDGTMKEYFSSNVRPKFHL